MSREKQIEEMAWNMCDVPKHPSITSCEKCNCHGKCHPMYYAIRAYNAGYRKKSENVVEFPCKPGQTLWFPSEYYGRPFPISVTHLEIYEEEIVIYSEGGSEWSGEDIGKTIFLTKEEAERALEKKKGGAE